MEAENEPILDAQPWIDLRKYDQSWFDRGKPGVYILLWWLVQSVFFPLTIQPLNKVRCWILRLFGATVGKGVMIRPTARFTYPWKVKIGDYSWIGDNVVFYSLDHIEIGCHCVISQHTYLCTGSHNMSDRTFGLVTAPIKIGNGAWVAANCFVAPGVKIGSNTVIGAGSSVWSHIPSEQVAWGSPCQSRYQRKMIN